MKKSLTKNSKVISLIAFIVAVIGALKVLFLGSMYTHNLKILAWIVIILLVIFGFWVRSLKKES